MPLTRFQQLFLVKETFEGVATTLFVNSNGNFINYDSSIDFDPNFYDRSPKRASLTPLQGLAGQQKGSVKARLELAGTAAIGSVPSFGLALQSCGFRQENLIKLTIGAITNGPFKHGETVTQATSGAIGMVVQDTYTGQTVIWIAQGGELGSGTFNGTNVITGGTSGATATPSAFAANAGIAWWPWSLPLTAIRFDATGLTDAISDGDLLKGTTSGALGVAYGAFTTGANKTVYIRRTAGHFTASEIMRNETTADTNIGALAATVHESQFQIPTVGVGLTKDATRESIKFARGTVSFSGALGEPMFMDFEWQGAKDQIVDGGNVSGISLTQVVPSVLLDSDLGMGKLGVTFALEHLPCIKNIAWAMNNDVQFGECMADPTGLTFSDIVNRKPSGTVDPDLLPESVFDWLTSMHANVNLRARFTVGSTLGNKFLVTMPGLAVKKAATGDRNGKATRTISFDLNGGAQGAAASSSDNEVVIVLQYV